MNAPHQQQTEDAFHKLIHDNSIYGLWEIASQMTPHPLPDAVPHIWKAALIESLVKQSATAVPVNDLTEILRLGANMKLLLTGSGTRARLAALLIGVCAAMAGAPAAAQDYPAREIRAICSFAAGSGGDILVRYYSDRLSRLAGRPVIVENKPGAQGVIGTEFAARSKPDGYTILITPASSTLAAAPHLFKKLPYDPIKDFTPVAPIARLNFVFVVDAKGPIKTMADLVAELKKKPDHGTYGINNNTGQVAAELFKEASQLKSLQVSYKTTVQGVTDLIGGQVDFLVGDATFFSGQARGGRVRIIAVTGPTRSGALPEVPTMAEAGFAGYDLTAWWGVVVPAGTPGTIVERLAAWMAQINATEETRQFLHNVATDVLNGTPDQMAAMITQDLERWGRYARVAKIEAQ